MLVGLRLKKGLGLGLRLHQEETHIHTYWFEEPKVFPENPEKQPQKKKNVKVGQTKAGRSNKGTRARLAKTPQRRRLLCVSIISLAHVTGTALNTPAER